MHFVYNVLFSVHAFYFLYRNSTLSFLLSLIRLLKSKVTISDKCLSFIKYFIYYFLNIYDFLSFIPFLLKGTIDSVSFLYKHVKPMNNFCIPFLANCCQQPFLTVNFIVKNSLHCRQFSEYQGKRFEDK